MIIPFARLCLGKRTVDCASEAVRSTWWTGGTGEYNEKLAEWLKKYGSYTLLVNSGTAACRAALFAALGGVLDEGNAVLTTAYSCAANVVPLYEFRVVPLFCDIDSSSYGISVESFRQELENAEKHSLRVRAVYLPYIYGEPPADAKEIVEVCKECGIVLIADISEAVGINERDVVGDVVVASMRTEKMLGCGEGGFIATDDERLYVLAKQFASRGKPVADKAPYWYTTYGDNVLMPHVTAAIAFGQLDTLETVLRGKRRVARMYRNSWLSNAFEFQVVTDAGVCWLNCGVAREDVLVNPVELGLLLGDFGIETRPAFAPLTRYWRALAGGAVKRTPVAEFVWRNGIVFPSPYDLTEEELNYVVEKTKEVLKC